MIKGFFEAIRPFQVRGWALDIEKPSERVTIALSLNGETIGRASADVFREDLMKVWDSDGHHGYIINLEQRVPDAAFGGLEVHAYSPTGETLRLPRIERMSIGEVGIPDSAAIPEPSTITGFVAAFESSFHGWAFDADNPAEHLRIGAYHGEELLGETVANIKRHDLVEAKIGEGDHAFVLECGQPTESLSVDKLRVKAATSTGKSNFLRFRSRSPLAAVKEAPNAKFPGPITDNEQYPVFVLGAARSGTSAVAQAIMRSSHFSGFEEGHLLDLVGTLLKAVSRHYEMRTEQNNTLAAASPSQFFEQGIKHVFAEFAKITFPTGKWIDKTPRPEMIACAPIFRQIWPNSTFIFMKRRAIENVVSRTRKFVGSTFVDHCEDWANAMRAWVQVRPLLKGAAIEIDQLFMARDPKRVADELADFLQLSAPEELKLTQSLALEQPERTSDRIEAVLSMDDWPPEQKAALTSICGPLMNQFGYDLGPSYFRPGQESQGLFRLC